MLTGFARWQAFLGLIAARDHDRNLGNVGKSFETLLLKPRKQGKLRKRMRATGREENSAGRFPLKFFLSLNFMAKVKANPVELGSRLDARWVEPVGLG